MKKIFATVFSVVALSASAGEVTVSAVRDFGLNANGVRVEAQVQGFTLSATRIADQYNRFGVGKELQLFASGPFSVSAGVGVGYQSTLAASDVNGFGLSAGAKAEYKLTKNLSALVGVEQFYGQSRISGFSNTTGTVGMKVSF